MSPLSSASKATSTNEARASRAIQRVASDSVGGALGNLYDRLLLRMPDGEVAHSVRDFLDFHILGFHYPTFNAADAFICVGAAMVVLRVLLDGRKKGRTPDGK